ncbi:MAG: hypothetical protein WAU88_06850 [Candidatus Zixiibacteriota bacterium]
MKIQAATALLNRVLLLSLTLGIAATSAPSQDRPQSLTTGPRMVVIPWRATEEIAGDIENAQATRTLAVNRRVQAEARLREIEMSIDTRKVSLKDVDRHTDDAKDGKRESEVVGLKIESKAKQQAIDLLGRLKELRKTEIEEAQAETELADMAISSLQMENELLIKRTGYDSLSVNGATELNLTTARTVLGELESRLLKLQQDQASATQRLASKQKDIVNRRIKLHDSQVKLGVPRA